MLSRMHYNIIKSFHSKEKIYMTLESILSKIEICNSIELLENAHESVRVLKDEVFYVQPKYEEIVTGQKARFIIFSAPGAAGKSALAKYITYKYHGLYWDLAKIKLGENSFHGTLWRAMKQEKLVEFFDNLKKGKNLLVLDAFDEAELISGRASVEYMLNDVNEVTKESTTPIVLLFARTESAIFISDFCKKNNIQYSQYEIGFFEEYNAKEFIRKKIAQSGKKDNLSLIIDNCIEEQFIAIKRLLVNDELAKSFIGYAPVLEALASSFDEERNTMKLLVTLKESDISGTNIIYRILEDLLNREQKKVCNGLKEKWEAKYPQFSDWNSVFTREEQIVRIVEYIIFGEVLADSFYEESILSSELNIEYIDSLKGFLPQHPFLQNTIKDIRVDFTGPAFRDYALAYLLSQLNYLDLALEYYADNSLTSHFPSQLLFDFYYVISKGETTGRIFPILYDSYKAKETAGKTTLIDITGNDYEKFLSFRLYDGTNTGSINETELHVNEDGPFYFSRLANTSIEMNGTIFIGEPKSMTRIFNSNVICDNIVFNSADILIEAREPGFCLLASKNDAINQLTEQPKFEILADDNKLVKIAIPNINSFYKLRPYKYALEEETGDEFFKFTMIVSKIMSCLRKHKKDVPAKDREFIDNEIISQSKLKSSILDFLLAKDIIYIDSNEPHLYKLDVDKLADYGINWVTLGQKDLQKFNILYEEYQKC